MIVQATEKIFLPRSDGRLNSHTVQLGKLYVVFELCLDRYRVVGRQGGPVLVEADCFEVVDPTVPADWVEFFDDDGGRYVCPPEFVGNFFERWHDGHAAAHEVFSRVSERLTLPLGPVAAAFFAAEQRRICRETGAQFVPSPSELKVAVARNVRDGPWPVNGLRHTPFGDTTGWYLWAGQNEPKTDDDFFVALHARHLGDWCPVVMSLLGLPPGSRFLIAPGHRDIWSDPGLLNE